VVFAVMFLVAATAMVKVHGSRAEVDEAAGDRGDLDCCGSGVVGGTDDLGGGRRDP
jgi:ABC-type xylose transport system permease subunit